MQLDKDTLRYVLDVAKSHEQHGNPITALISRLSYMLEEQKFRLGVGDMARTKGTGKYVVITEVHDGGYLVAYADDLSKSMSLHESDIDFGGMGS